MTRPAPFEHHRPTTLARAIELAGELGATAMVLAGGTELVPKMRRGVHAPAHLISINGITELARIATDPTRGLSIGAGVRLHDVAKHEAVRRGYPALAQACSQMATPQIRHMGTVAGNLVNGSPCADTAGPLLVYDATVTVASTSGQRTLRLQDFFQDAGLTALGEGEILVSVDVPPPPLGAHSAFRRLSARGRVDVAAVSATALIETHDDGRVAHARIAIGAVAPTALRCPDGERS
ncbi:MAG: xanthine dehydrogenase family protein subunit M, partial [Deltaproteobacteria bacterium]|nr:xanthine dehydrogenase family protein subunit M [Deltaproteobacteria bacterium]MBW2536985.1 xanthine dehydrogenase family protein subunit M [Deltaproteobacteria bacterium]